MTQQRRTRNPAPAEAVVPAYEIIEHRLPGGVQYRVEGLPARFYDTRGQAEEGAMRLQRKISAQEVSEDPRCDGQVYQLNGGFRFYPCRRLFATWDLADAASRAYLGVLGLADHMVEAVLDRIMRGENTDPYFQLATAGGMVEEVAAIPYTDWTQIADHAVEVVDVTDSSWQPVTRLCQELRSPLNLGTLVANLNRAYSCQSGTTLYYNASMLAVMGLLTTLASDPTHHAYDVADVYHKLSLYSMWLSSPPLEGLRRLHALLTPRVFGTPAGTNWNLDPTPGLTTAKQRLATEEDERGVFRKIRPGPIASAEDGVS